MTGRQGGDRWVRRFHRASADAPCLVCLPHAGGSATFFHPVSAALHPVAEVLAVQYPGRADRLDEQPIGEMARLADEVFESLRPWVGGRTVLLGHSMGAILAFEVARRMEQRIGVVPERLIASACRAPSRPRHEQVHLRDDDGILDRVLSLGGTDQRLREHEDLLRLLIPAIRADYRALETYLPPPGGTVSCPISVLVGDRDPRVPLDAAKAWSEHTTADFDLYLFEGGHFFPNERTAEFTERLGRLLAVAS